MESEENAAAFPSDPTGPATGDDHSYTTSADATLVDEPPFRVSTTEMYAWLEGEPVALLVRGSARKPLKRLTFLHGDHLGRPSGMTDSAGLLVWRPEYEPFGKSLEPRTNTIPGPGLRFPGQRESRLSIDLPDGDQDYLGKIASLTDNWHRTYVQRWGRYSQPDPADFAWSVFPDQYPYANQNPMRNTDATGLFSVAQNCSGDLFGKKLAAGISDFCGKLRPGTKCNEALKNINAALGHRTDVLPRCMQEACDGTQTLGCNDCQEACGANFPSFGRPVIVVGPGQMSSCPVSKGLGFGPTIFHETLHTCGFGGTDPHLANTEASWFRYAEMACFGWRDPLAPPFGPPGP